MTLNEIIEMQKTLDQRIHESKGLCSKDTLKSRIVALSVELAEMANEMRFFKFWSTKTQNEERILEEAADCLHFIVSIGNELGFIPSFNDRKIGKTTDPTQLYLKINKHLVEIDGGMGEYSYGALCDGFCELLALYDISTQDLFNEYKIKNRVNHQRQDEGY